MGADEIRSPALTYLACAERRFDSEAVILSATEGETKMIRAFVVMALLLAAASGGSIAGAAGPPGSSAAVTGEVTLDSQAQWVSPVAINVGLTWQCSEGVAILRVDVVQQSTTGLAKRAVVCDGARHPAAVTVHSLVGTFQLGDATATATLTVLQGPPASFSDQRTIQIVAR